MKHNWHDTAYQLGVARRQDYQCSTHSSYEFLDGGSSSIREKEPRGTILYLWRLQIFFF